MVFPRVLRSTLVPANLPILTRCILLSPQQATTPFVCAWRSMGDLNITEAAREHVPSVLDPAYRFRSFGIHACDDDPAVRQRYRPFLLSDEISASDWVAKLELATAAKMVEAEILSQRKDRLRVLVLYGSLRSRFEPISRRSMPESHRLPCG